MLSEPRLLAANPWATLRPTTVTEYRRMSVLGIPAGSASWASATAP
jgi:hypothetical protein